MEEQKKMSAKDIEIIIGKAIGDQSYRDLLFKDPEKAAIGFKLNAGEEKALKKLSPIFFEQAIGKLQAASGAAVILELKGLDKAWFPDPPG